MSHTPNGASTPARPFRYRVLPPPIDPAKRRIKIARAINLIARTKVSVTVALRATGLDHDHAAREDVAVLLDLRGIPRIRKGVRRVRFPQTPSRVFEEFVPRRNVASTHGSLAGLVAALVEVADPLGPQMSSQLVISEADAFQFSVRTEKPTIIVRCRECNGRFEARSLGAKFCSSKCRVYSWRV
jgi:hypothetical protein